MNSLDIINSTKAWLETIVIGMNFCPFARKPFESDLVRLTSSDAQKDDDILEKVLEELNRLEDTPSSELETTLIIFPNAYPDFEAFNSLLYVLNEMLVMEGFEGTFQIASFHPDYQFAGTNKQDVENYTNRAPYPIIHLLREDSVYDALEQHPDPDNIPNKNIQRLQSLSEQDLKKYFSYIYK